MVRGRPKVNAKLCYTVVMKLTAKQEKFCQEYLIHLNATKAALNAGYSPASATEIGCENLTKPHIAARLQEYMIDAQQKTKITLERVLEEIGRLALFDTRMLYDDEGRLLQPHELSEDAARAISSFKSRKETSGSDTGEALDLIEEYKTYDKSKSLDMLMRYFKAYDEGNQGGPDGAKPQKKRVVIARRSDKR